MASTAASCFLVGRQWPPAQRRLRALVEHSDGFRLAEIDLELRSEGELMGTRQSGLGQFQVAQRCPRTRRCSSARERAREAIVAADPELRRPSTRCWVRRSSGAFGGRGARADPCVGSGSPQARHRPGPLGSVHASDRGEPRWQALEGSEWQGHPADLRSGEGGAVRDAGRARGGERARPVRRHGRARDRGALAGRGERGVRRARRRRRAGC